MPINTTSNHTWEPLLAKYFMTILENDIQCEEIKQNLASNINFIPESIFNKLDTDNKNFLSLNDFRNFLRNNQSSFQDETLRKFIHNYDRDRDFALDENEVMNIILTKNSDLRDICLERKETLDNQEINQELNNLLIQLIQKELNTIEELAILADEIKNMREFNGYEAFLTIDFKNNKYISNVSLNNFLSKNEFNITDEYASEIIRRLDHDGDGQVSYEEFQEIFIPLRVGRIPRNDLTNGNFNFNSNFNFSNSNNFSKLSMSNQNENNIERNNTRENFVKQNNNNKNENIKILNNNEDEPEIEELESQEQANNKNSNNNIEIEENNEENYSQQNDLSKNPIMSTYNEKFFPDRNRRNLNIEDNNYNENNLVTDYNVDRDRNFVSTSKSKEKFFSSTMSTIQKNILSPMRSTNNDDLNFRASMNTYTSPSREQGVNYNNYKFNNYNDSNFSENLNLNNNNIYSYPFIRRNYENDLRDYKYYNYYEYYNNNVAINQSKRYFSPNRINTKNDYSNRNSRNEEYISPNRNNYSSSLSPRRNLNMSKNVKSSNYYFTKYDNEKVDLNNNKNQNEFVHKNYNDINKSITFNLANLFNDLLNLDLSSELYRESLSLNSEINLKSLFSLFDISNRNSVSLVDLKESLKQFNIFSTIDELKLVFKRYDLNLDGRLDFAEFSNIFIPKKLEYSKLLRNRFYSDFRKDLSFDAKKNLTLLLKSLIDAEVTAEFKRKLLSSTPGFSSYENYENVKGRFRSYIIKEDLKTFMQENGFFMKNLELDVLFERLDKNQDGKITFNEFIFELVPRYNSA